MDNLSYILYICMTAGLCLMLPIIEKNSRKVILFLLIGISACLVVSELNSFLLGFFDGRLFYVTTTITPVTEEIIKAFPVLYFAILISDDRRTLITISYAVGVGFALFENVVIMSQSIGQVTLLWALVRSFGSGLVHGLCTVMVGYGISYVRKRKKLFYCGTFALLSSAIIYHATYNVLIQSSLHYAGVLLPVATYVPVFLLVGEKGRKKKRA